MRTNLLRSIAVMLLLLSPQAFAFAATAFSSQKVQWVYEKLEKKLNKQASAKSINPQTDAGYLQKKEALKKALIDFDTAYTTKNKKTLPGAIKQVKKTYSAALLYLASLQKVVATPPAVSTEVVLPLAENPNNPTINPVDEILYYADSMEGANTSFGEKFSQKTFSAANCSAALGTLIQVVSGEKSVVVKNNDRPSCIKHPSMVDLSTIAFTQLAPLSKWRISGYYVSLNKLEYGATKSYLNTATFWPLGIEFDGNIPALYLENDTFMISGRVSDGKKMATIHVSTPSDKKIDVLASVDESGRFVARFPIREIGKYTLIVASGNSFNTTLKANFWVISRDILKQKKTFASVTQDKLTNLDIQRVTSLNGLSTHVFLGHAERYYELRLTQGSKTLSTFGMSSFALLPLDTSIFDMNKEVEVLLLSTPKNTPFSLDIDRVMTPVFYEKVLLAQSFANKKQGPLKITKTEKGIIIDGTTEGANAISADIFITQPDGLVVKESFAESVVDKNTNALLSGVYVNKEINLSQKGMYLVEVNDTRGFALLNQQLAFGSYLAIAPNEVDQMKEVSIGNQSQAEVIRGQLAKINAFRKKHGKSEVALDLDLNLLAQSKTDDMIAYNYVGHTDSRGEKINKLVERIGIGENYTAFGENVANGTFNADVLFVNLTLSSAHRWWILLDDWDSVGIGYGVKDGVAYLVQVFATKK